jgi:alpha-L-rhamnosidase
MRVTHLTTEYLVNPLGLDTPRPRLSWRLDAPERGAKQTAYHILAASDPARLAAGTADLWDSGRVESDESVLVEYAGAALRSGQRAHWQVRAWDGAGQPTEWSAPAWWEMGLLEPGDWQAAWISPGAAEHATPNPLLRGTFDVSGTVVAARAYVTALGLYELELNGRRVGDWLLTPGWTSYNKRLQYQVYDVTPLLRPGRNALGALLGDGWYRGRMGWVADKDRHVYGGQVGLLAQITITYADGRVQVVGTDAAWKHAPGPIVSSELYDGEAHDARLERPGWSTSDYDDAGWAPVQAHRVADERRNLVAQVGVPVRRINELKPIGVIQTPAGETLLDFGQNMVGWVRMRVSGEAGATITLRHAEVLDADGNFYTANLRSAKQTDTYTLKGDGEEIFEPRFTFHGFRYVAVAGYPGEVTLDNFTGVVIHSDMPATGAFECSDPLINQLQHNITWGQKGNFVDVPTDCPQRDERMGWTGDAQAFARTAAFNYRVAGFMTKWLRDVAADQWANGAVPHVVPDVLRQAGSTGWGDAATIVPWVVYQCYGDKRLLAEQYPSMAAWVGYGLAQAGDDLIWDGGFHFGDWLAVKGPDANIPNPVTNISLISTAFLAHATHLTAKAARVLGKLDDAAKYDQLFADIKSAFNREFVTPSGRIGPDTQTAYVLALQFELLPPELHAQAARRLADDVRRRDHHLTTGFLGASHLSHVLSDYGYLDEAYALLHQETYPSWLYPVTKGATTIWERWDGLQPDGKFQDVGMNSFNHYAYGAIGDWLYRVVAGINQDPDAPGYKRILLRPRPGGKLTYARASHDSLYGKIESGWARTDSVLKLDVTIPPNTEAEVHLPASSVAAVTEGGKPLGEAAGVRLVREAAGEVVVGVGAGKYEFAVAQAVF